jgi:WD40 repeat protein
MISTCRLLFRMLLRSRLSVILLAVLTLGCTFFVFHRILPVSPEAVLHLGDNAEFLTFSPDSSAFATARTGGFDKIGPLRIWAVPTGSERLSLHPEWNALQSVLFSSDSRLIAAYEKDGDLNVWDAQTGEELFSLRPPPERTTGLLFRFTPDGQYLAVQDLSSTSDDKDFVRFWRIRIKKDVGRIESYFGRMQIAPDSRSIINFGCDDHYKLDRVMFWSPPGEGPPRRLREFPIRADGGAFSPDLSTMASFESPADPDEPTEITLWDMVTGLKRCSFPYDEREVHVQHLSFSADGRVLVANGGGGWQLDWRTRTTLWDIASTPIQIGSFSPGAVLSSGGEWLAVPDENGATLYRVTGMQQHGNWKQLPQHLASVTMGDKPHHRAANAVSIGAAPRFRQVNGRLAFGDRLSSGVLVVVIQLAGHQDRQPFNEPTQIVHPLEVAGGIMLPVVDMD